MYQQSLALRRIALPILLLLLLLWACSDETDPVEGPDANSKATCQDCHTDEAMLRATAVPDPPTPEDSGEG